jgi:hypothetical protein
VGTGVTVTTAVSVAVTVPIFTVRVTVKTPVALNAWVTCSPVAGDEPSPKFHQ